MSTEREPVPAGHIGWIEFISPRATTHIAYVRENGEVYLPEDGAVTPAEFHLAAASARFWPLVRAEDAEAKVAAVREVHQPHDAVMYSGKKQYMVKVCTGCGTDDGNWQRWPCQTIKALDGGV